MSRTIFTSQTPVLTDANDATAYTLGTYFYATSGESAVGIRWYFPATTIVGTVTAVLYRVSDTAELATKVFASPAAGAWNYALFDAPVSLTANTFYVAAIHTPNRYVATVDFFDAQTISNSTLRAPQVGSDPLGQGSTPNGVLHEGAAPAFPEVNGGGNCYFADILVADTVTLAAAAGLGSLAGTAAAVRGVIMTAGATLGGLAAVAAMTRVPATGGGSGGGGWGSLLSVTREMAAVELGPVASCWPCGGPLTAGPDGSSFCVFDGWRPG